MHTENRLADNYKNVENRQPCSLKAMLQNMINYFVYFLCMPIYTCTMDVNT